MLINFWVKLLLGQKQSKALINKVEYPKAYVEN